MSERNEPKSPDHRCAAKELSEERTPWQVARRLLPTAPSRIDEIHDQCDRVLTCDGERREADPRVFPRA